MSFASLLLLSLGVAADAAAVSAARGLAVSRLRLRHAVLVAAFFGGAQALMPALGATLGDVVGVHLRSVGPLLACVVLVGLGAKMLWSARASSDDADADADFSLRVMAALAFATSIDAFAVGVTLPMMHAPVALAVASMGMTTAVLSVVALVVSHRFGALFGKRRMDVLGGLALVLMGLKIAFSA
jgi:manganese efflux pump family protein